MTLDRKHNSILSSAYALYYALFRAVSDQPLDPAFSTEAVGLKLCQSISTFHERFARKLMP